MLSPPVTALFLVLAYLVLCCGCWHRYSRFQRRQHPAVAARDTTLIAFASQGGTAERIARQDAEALLQRHHAVTVMPLNSLTPVMLRNCRRIFFVVSTYGDGDAPDNGSLFARRHVNCGSDIDATGLSYAVLALGDRRYPHFCGFGQQLHRALLEQGALPLWEPVLVDRENSTALHRWRINLFGNADEAAAEPTPPPLQVGRWRLVGRSHLNPGSPGTPVCLLHLEPVDSIARKTRWIAGDIAQVFPGTTRETEPPRDYSIASLSGDGTLDLVVRQHRRADGSMGLASGWLTQDLALQEEICMGVRRNSAFHPAPADAPMILVGNGTGIAGLRAHLRDRERHGAHRNWLLFGERSPVHDRLFEPELLRWCDSRHLQRLDRAFSRDQSSPRYVQDLLLTASETLTEWVNAGAALMVCGSDSMGRDVDTALRHLLGHHRVDELIANGLYRRDVY